MKIKNKGELIEAFAQEEKKVLELTLALEKASLNRDKYAQAICIDDSLIETIQEGGFKTIHDDLVFWCDKKEELQLAKCFNAISLSDLALNEDQLKLIGECHE